MLCLVIFLLVIFNQWVRGMADGTALLNSVSRIESLRASVEKTDPHRIEATRPDIAWPLSGSVRGGCAVAIISRAQTCGFRPFLPDLFVCESSSQKFSFRESCPFYSLRARTFLRMLCIHLFADPIWTDRVQVRHASLPAVARSVSYQPQLSYSRRRKDWRVRPHRQRQEHNQCV